MISVGKTKIVDWCQSKVMTWSVPKRYSGNYDVHAKRVAQLHYALVSKIRCAIACKCGIECQNHGSEKTTHDDLEPFSSDSESDSD